MAKKTVFRRLSKWIPLSPEFRDAVEVDDEPIDVTPKRGAAPSLALEAATSEQPIDYYKAVRGLLKLAGLTDTDLYEWLVSTGRVDGTASATPDDVKMVHDDWSVVEPLIRAHKAAKQKPLNSAEFLPPGASEAAKELVGMADKLVASVTVE